MFFASDNSGPAHPSVMEALVAANAGYAMGYGADTITARAIELIRDAFEAPEAEVFFVATGTAANALALATICAPFATVFCAEMAHIHADECNAPEFYSGGAKLTLVPAPDGKMTPDGLRQRIAGEETRGVHGPLRGPVSFTNVTELGTVYTAAELGALTQVARDFGLPTHLDGARLAGALVATGASAADMTWRAGVDVLSFGGTKNGLLGAEAVVFFDPELARGFAHRRKRGGHLFSKHRYLAAQMAAYMEGDLWLDLAARANAANSMLVNGLREKGAAFAHAPQANLSFVTLPRATHQRLFDAGASYHLWEASLEGDKDEQITARLVTDWSTNEAAIRAFLALL
ncbi:MAG: threonine aldolase family protein [Maritimibacter sp.]